MSVPISASTIDSYLMSWKEQHHIASPNSHGDKTYKYTLQKEYWYSLLESYLHSDTLRLQRLPFAIGDEILHKWNPQVCAKRHTFTSNEKNTKRSVGEN